MKRNIFLISFVAFLLCFITVAHASFTADLRISGEGRVEGDSVPPTCGAWNLRKASETYQEAYDNNSFINPVSNSTWRSEDLILSIECSDNMSGSYGCIDVNEITDNSDHKVYYKDVKNYNASIKTDNDAIVVKLQDAYLNERTCTLPAGGSNPYIDKKEPTLTIIPSASNKFTYVATDDLEVEGYMVTETNTMPSINDSKWSKDASEFTIDNTKSKLYYVWAKDGINITSKAISTIKLEQIENKGSNLVLRENDSSGEIINSKYILNNSKVYLDASTKDGYHMLVTKKDGNNVTNKNVYTLSEDTTFETSATPISYTFKYHANGGIGAMSSQLMVYDVAQNLLENKFTRLGFVFKGWNTIQDAEDILYSDKQEVSNGSIINNEVVTLYAIWKPLTMFDIGEIVDTKMKQLSGVTDAGKWTFVPNITSFEKSDVAPDMSQMSDANIVSLSTSKYPIYAWFDNGAIYWWSEDDTVYFHPQSYQFFCRLNGITDIDISGINGSLVENYESFIRECTNLERIVGLEELDTSNATNMRYMFSSNPKLTSLDLSNFNTEKVVYMENMFSASSGLKELDLSNFYTPNLAGIGGMFRDCSSLETLDIHNINTSKVGSFEGMLYNCVNLKSLDMSSFDFSGSGNRWVFSNNPSLSSIKTPKVQLTSGVVGLPALYHDDDYNDYKELNTSTPSDIWIRTYTMFADGRTVNNKFTTILTNQGANYASVIKILRSDTEPSDTIKNNTNNVISTLNSGYPIYAWYEDGVMYYYSEDTDLYLNPDSSRIFSGFEKMEEIDLSTIKSDYVTNTYLMFNNDRRLVSLDLSNFDLSNVTYAPSMFNSTPALTRIKTPKAYPESVSFALQNKLFDEDDNEYTSLDKTSPTETWLKGVITYTFIFSRNQGNGSMPNQLMIYDVGQSLLENKFTRLGFVFKGWNTDPNAEDILYADQEVVSDGCIFNGESVTLYAIWEPLTMFDIGEIVDAKMKQLSGVTDAGRWTSVSNITSFQKSNIPPDISQMNDTNIVSVSTSKYPIYAWFDEGAIYWWSEDDTVYFHPQSYQFFCRLTGITDIDISGINGSLVENFESFIRECSNLERIVGLEELDTSNATNMKYMFSSNPKLTSLDLSNFNTEKVVYMDNMFASSSGLKELDLSNFYTPNLAGIGGMFRDCSSLETLDIHNINTSKVGSFEGMLYNCTSLKSLDMSSFDFSSTGNRWVFNNNPSLSSIKTPKVQLTSGVVGLPALYHDDDYNDYKELNTSTPSDIWIRTYTMFADGRTVNNKFNSILTSQGVNFNSVIRILRSETEPSDAIKNNQNNIISTLNSGYPIYAWYEDGVIYYYSEDTDLYLNPDSSRIFAGFEKMEEIDLSTIKSDYVTNTYLMFNNDRRLVSLDLSNFDLSNVTYAPSMFNSTPALTSIKTPKAYPESVSFGLSNTLRDSEGNEYTSIDKTSPTQTWLRGVITYTFAYNRNQGNGSMPNQIMIYGVGQSLLENKFTRLGFVFLGWNTDSSATEPLYSDQEVVSDGCIFNGETVTLYAIWKPLTMFDYGETVNAKMKQLAGYSGANKWTSAPNITEFKKSDVAPDMSQMSDANIVSLSSSKYPIYAWFDDGTIYYYSEDDVMYMHPQSYQFFCRFDGVTNIEFENIDTSLVETMDSMFRECTSLETIDLSSFDTSNVTNMANMFLNSNKLKNINVTGFDTGKVTTMSNMFSGCTSLVNLDLNNFYTPNLNTVASMFYNCSSLKNLDISNLDTTKVGSYEGMFRYSGLTTLDISSFNMTNASSTSSMLENMYYLSSIKTPKSGPLNKTLALNKVMVDETGTEYTIINSTTPGETWLHTHTMFDVGKNVNEKIKRLSGSNTAFNGDDYNVKHFVRTYDAPDTTNFNSNNILSTSDSGYPIYAWFESGTLYWYSEDSTVYLNSDSSHFFNGYRGMYDADFSGVDSSLVTNMFCMFASNFALNNLDLSNFDLSKVTNAGAMFNLNNALTKLKTPKVMPTSVNVDLPRSLYDEDANEYTKLTSTTPTSIWLEEAILYTVQYDSNGGTGSMGTQLLMFGRPTELLSNEFSNGIYPFIGWNTKADGSGDNYENNASVSGLSNVKGSIVTLYAQWGKVTMLDTGTIVNNKLNTIANGTIIHSILPSREEPNLTSMNDNNIISITDSKFPVYAWLDNDSIYYYSEDDLIYLNFDSSSLFKDFNTIKMIDISNMNTSQVTNMSNMFNGLKGLATIELSNFDTSNVTDMSGMFANCNKLMQIDLGEFDMNKVNNTTDMLLNEVSLVKIRTPKVYSNNENIVLPKTLIDETKTSYASLSTESPTSTWLTLPKYTLSFNSNGGSIEETSRELMYGMTYNDLPTPTREGYEFKGWYADLTGNNFVNLGRNYMYEDSFSIHISTYMNDWNQYTNGRIISSIENGGFSIDETEGKVSFTLYNNSSNSYIKAISSIEYTSLASGWHDFDAIYDGRKIYVYIDGILEATSTEIISETKYDETNSIMVGAEPTSSPTIPEDNYNFEGYIGNIIIKNDSNLITTNIYNSITMPEQDLTLYAIWTPIITKVTLNEQGGTGGTTSISIPYDTKKENFPEIIKPSKTGLLFDGYYTEPNGGGIKYYNLQGNSVRDWDVSESKITLYANYISVYAENVGYDNTKTGVSCSDVQCMIDELYEYLKVK